MLHRQQAITLYILGKSTGDTVYVLLLHPAAAIEQPGVFVGDVAIAVLLQQLSILLQGKLGGGVDTLGQGQQKQHRRTQQNYRERWQIALAIEADQHRIIPCLALAGFDTAKHPGFA